MLKNRKDYEAGNIFSSYRGMMPWQDMNNSWPFVLFLWILWILY